MVHMVVYGFSNCTHYYTNESTKEHDYTDLLILQ